MRAAGFQGLEPIPIPALAFAVLAGRAQRTGSIARRRRGLKVAIVGFDSHRSEPPFDLAARPDSDSTPPVVSLLDAKGAAALLNVPASWVLAEARADRIPHVRLGRYVRFDAAELQTWAVSRRRGPWRSGATVGERVATANLRSRRAA